MLFNEPKLLKYITVTGETTKFLCFSALQRAEIAEIKGPVTRSVRGLRFSALQRAEIAEIYMRVNVSSPVQLVSVLFNEPKLLKYCQFPSEYACRGCFSALQRAEIAEITHCSRLRRWRARVSVLFNEPKLLKFYPRPRESMTNPAVSVLFNEPKLLKSSSINV